MIDPDGYELESSCSFKCGRLGLHQRDRNRVSAGSNVEGDFSRSGRDFTIFMVARSARTIPFWTTGPDFYNLSLMFSDSSLSQIIPSQIVHYNRSEPFRSLTSVEQQQIPEVIGSLNEKNAWGIGRFSDPKYLIQRFDVEDCLRQRFVDIGGKPTLRNPIYFFLGRHPIFEKHKSNIGYSIELKDLDPYSVSFTYGDSMFSLVEENRVFAGAKYSNPICTEVFWLETLPKLFSHSSFPKIDPLHVEAQLWTEPDLAKVKIIDR